MKFSGRSYRREGVDERQVLLSLELAATNCHAGCSEPQHKPGPARLACHEVQRFSHGF